MPKRRASDLPTDPVAGAAERAVREAEARAADALRRARAIVRKIDEPESRDLAHRYVEGEGTGSIAAALGVTSQTVINRLTALGIPIRPSLFPEPLAYRRKAGAHRVEAMRLERVADIVQGFEKPPQSLLARTTGTN